MSGKNYLFLYFFFFTGVIFNGILSAQTIKNFSSVGGKKDMGVAAIAQNREGILWLGTKEGLVRFNGKSSAVLKKEDGLSDNEITALFVDSKNRVWAGHRSGKISIVTGNKPDSFAWNSKMPESPIACFYEDAKGKIYIGTHGSGLRIFDGTKIDSLNSQNGLADDIVYTIAFDGKNNLWAGTDAGINIIDLNAPAKNILHIGSKDGLPDNIVRCIVNDSSGNMIAAMQDSGLCFYSLSNRKFIRNPFLSSWNLGPITGVIHKSSGSLLIAAENNGVLSIEKGRLKIFNNTNGLLNNSINCLFRDREQNLWAGTAKGLSFIYQQRHTMISGMKGMLPEKVSCVYADEDETLWTGSEKGVSEIMLDETGSYKVKNWLQDLSAKGIQVSCMLRPDKQRVIFGTYSSGIVLLNIESGKTNHLHSKNGLANDNVSLMCLDKNGKIWVSTLGGGIQVLDSSGVPLQSYTESENGLGSDYVYAVFCDSKNNIWAGVDGGGLQLLKEKQFIRPAALNKLQSKTVYSITEDKSGNIWFVSSDDGVVRYDGSNFEIYSVKNGLRDALPPVIAASGNKIVCVHNKGIDVLETGKTETITYFDISENDLEPNLNAVHTNKNGTIWFGTNSGIVKFRANDIAEDTITPAAFITALKVQYKDYGLQSTHDFSYKQNNLIFEFDATWLKAPDKIKYRWMLAGLEDNWQQITASSMAAYNNLPPGNYEFKVEACNEEGVWGRPAVYKFSIAAPLWHRWWFWALILSAVISAVWLFMKYRLKALQKQNIILENKVNERTAEIVKQNKVIEEKNKELEQLSLVASQTENVVLIMDAEGKIEYINESFKRLNSVTLDELVEQKGPTIFDISNHPRIREIISEAVSDKKSINYESLNILKNGERVWESSTFTPIYDDAGALKKMIIIDTDVTERKKQEEIIVQKNRDITDSINYAHKIQRAILPDISLIKKDIPESFVLYLIKDIVSGDFYWFSHKDAAGIIAAVDCTGHGVPGAFMSMIGCNLLNQIVNERNITEPAKILTELNKGVILALHKKNSEESTKDGMDTAICKVNMKTNTVEYAGAMRPLWIIKSENGNAELREIKADKVSIGTLPENEEYHQYTNHVLTPAENETLYIFTDGYADQFGGSKGKKMTTGRFKEFLLEIQNEEMEEQSTKLLQHHLNWKGMQEQVDDILVLGIRGFNGKK